MGAPDITPSNVLYPDRFQRGHEEALFAPCDVSPPRAEFGTRTRSRDIAERALANVRADQFKVSFTHLSRDEAVALLAWVQMEALTHYSKAEWARLQGMAQLSLSLREWAGVLETYEAYLLLRVTQLECAEYLESTARKPEGETP